MNEKIDIYREVTQRLEAVLADETDTIAAMATIVCELHHACPHFDWTGFYRVTEPQMLTIGPYQGSLGCLRIPFDKGVCGKTARSKQAQIISDVDAILDHIACSSTTKSEITIPVFDKDKNVIAVFDVDSNELNAFDDTDREFLEKICTLIHA